MTKPKPEGSPFLVSLNSDKMIHLRETPGVDGAMYPTLIIKVALDPNDPKLALDLGDLAKQWIEYFKSGGPTISSEAWEGALNWDVFPGVVNNDGTQKTMVLDGNEDPIPFPDEQLFYEVEEDLKEGRMVDEDPLSLANLKKYAEETVAPEWFDAGVPYKQMIEETKRKQASSPPAPPITKKVIPASTNNNPRPDVPRPVIRRNGEESTSPNPSPPSPPPPVIREDGRRRLTRSGAANS